MLFFFPSLHPPLTHTPPMPAFSLCTPVVSSTVHVYRIVTVLTVQSTVLCETGILYLCCTFASLELINSLSGCVCVCLFSCECDDLASNSTLSVSPFLRIRLISSPRALWLTKSNLDCSLHGCCAPVTMTAFVVILEISSFFWGQSPLILLVSHRHFGGAQPQYM